MKKTFRALRPVLLGFLMMTILCGAVYPAIVTAVAQTAFSGQANGSIVTVTLKDGTKKSYGSELIYQAFTKPQYLIGRPAGASNLSPTSQKQKKLVQERISWWHEFDPDNKADIPEDLVTASGSGVDPDISTAAAEYQVSRIARVRGISEDVVREVIRKYTTGRVLGFWGEPGVNVLKVNLALDGLL